MRFQNFDHKNVYDKINSPHFFQCASNKSRKYCANISVS